MNIIDHLSRVYDDYLIWGHIFLRTPIYFGMFWAIKANKGNRMLWILGLYAALFLAHGGK